MLFCKAFEHTEVTKSVFVFDELGGRENFNSTSAQSQSLWDRHLQNCNYLVLQLDGIYLFSTACSPCPVGLSLHCNTNFYCPFISLWWTTTKSANTIKNTFCVKNIIPYYSKVYFLILVYNRRIILLGRSSIFYLLSWHSRQKRLFPEHKSVSDLGVKDETSGREQNNCSEFNFVMDTAWKPLEKGSHK